MHKSGIEISSIHTYARERERERERVCGERERKERVYYERERDTKDIYKSNGQIQHTSPIILH